MSDLRDQVVSAIQGNAVSPNDPQDKQLMQWNASTKRWEPTNNIVSTGINGASVQADNMGNVTVTSTNGYVYLVIPVTSTSISVSATDIEIQVRDSNSSGATLNLQTTANFASSNANTNLIALTTSGGIPTVSMQANNSTVNTSITLQPNSVALASVPTQTTTPSAGAADPLPATPAGYLQVVINGNTQYIPYY